MQRFCIYIFFRGVRQKQQWGLTMLGPGLPSGHLCGYLLPIGRALLTLLTILWMCRLGFCIWRTPELEGWSVTKLAVMSREAGSFDRCFSRRELEGSMVPEGQSPSEKAWEGRQGGRETNWMRNESPCALGFNSLVLLLLFMFILSLEKNMLPLEIIH